jgi:predicted AAA+ superfamily ATPase
MSQFLQEDIELFRPIFIENLKRFKDEQIIKILCGVRRCGKSTILKSYKNELLSLGVKEQNIIERLYTSVEFDSDFDYRKMYHELMVLIENAEKNQKIYLLLDEVQEVENWEKCVNSLF